MTTRITWTRLAAASVCLLVQACSGGSAQPSQDDAGGDDPSRTYAPTMTAVYNEILVGRCAIAFCHLGLAGSPPVFTDQESSYRALVNVHASGTMCGPQGADGGDAGAAEDAASVPILVVPDQPDASLLYRKIERPSPAGLCGDPMPGGGEQQLTDKDIQQIHDWIAKGALNN